MNFVIGRIKLVQAAAVYFDQQTEEPETAF